MKNQELVVAKIFTARAFRHFKKQLHCSISYKTAMINIHYFRKKTNE